MRYKDFRKTPLNKGLPMDPCPCPALLGAAEAVLGSSW